MKQLYVIIFLFLNTLAFAQETPANRYAIGAFFSPDFTFPANTVQEVKGYASYSYGAFFNANVGARSRVGIGINQSSRQILTEGVTFSNNYDSLSQTFDTTFSYITDKQFIQIPVRWSRYFVKKDRFGIYVTAGVSFNMQYGEKTRWRAEPESGERIKNYHVYTSNARIYGINPFIGGGIDFNITDQLLVAIQPEYGFYFLKDSDYTLQTLGAGFLISYRF